MKMLLAFFLSFAPLFRRSSVVDGTGGTGAPFLLPFGRRGAPPFFCAPCGFLLAGRVGAGARAAEKNKNCKERKLFD